MATKKSIRLRILKPTEFVAMFCATHRYKKIDPFADTETRGGGNMAGFVNRYKKIDPFADTETSRVCCNTSAVLRYKKIDPFADTETFAQIN